MRVIRRKRTLRNLGTPVAVWLWLHSAGVAQVSVQVSNGSANPGAQTSLAISMASSNGSTPTVMQFILLYSSSVVSGMTLEAGPAAKSAGKQLTCAATVGSQQCAVWGMNNNTIANGVIATASFEVSSTVTNSSSLGMTGTQSSSAQAISIPTTGSGGTLTIKPSVLVKTLACSPSTIFTPADATCTATLSATAASAITLALGVASGSNPVTAPSSVTVPAGATSVAFPVEAGLVTGSATAVVVGSFAGSSASFSLTLEPPPLGINCTPTLIVTPASSTCSVHLGAAAPKGGALIGLKLATPVAAITMPSSVTIPTGSTSASFEVKANTVSASTTAVIEASYGADAATFALDLAPP
jgi:hypothetical protein